MNFDYLWMNNMETSLLNEQTGEMNFFTNMSGEHSSSSRQALDPELAPTQEMTHQKPEGNQEYFQLELDIKEDPDSDDSQTAEPFKMIQKDIYPDGEQARQQVQNDDDDVDDEKETAIFSSNNGSGTEDEPRKELRRLLRQIRRLEREKLEAVQRIKVLEEENKQIKTENAEIKTQNVVLRSTVEKLQVKSSVVKAENCDQSEEEEDDLAVTNAIEICRRKVVSYNITNTSDAMTNHPTVSGENLSTSADMTVKCSICGERFDTLVRAEAHIKTVHFNFKKFKCYICKQRFHTQEELTKHKNTHSPAKRNTCDICGKRLTSKEGLAKHIEGVHMRKKAFKCDICGDAFHVKSKLSSHLKNHAAKHKRSNYQCYLCGQRFLNATDYYIHCSLHQFTCETCGREFPSESSLNLHKTSHAPVKKCKDCGQDFLKFHHCKKLVPFSCDLCGKNYTHLNSIRRHLDKHVPYPKGLPRRIARRLAAPPKSDVKKTKRMCDICGKLVSYCNLAEHKLRHTGQRPHVCPVCGMSFVAKNDMKRHERLHSAQGTFICDICGADFTRADYLTTHKRRHLTQESADGSLVTTKELVKVGRRRNCPYKCPLCGQTMSTEEALQRHMREGKHKFDVSIRNVSCEICGKKFRKKSLLTKHMPTHSQTKPHTCDICGNSYKWFNNLVAHKKTHDAANKETKAEVTIGKEKSSSSQSVINTVEQDHPLNTKADFSIGNVKSASQGIRNSLGHDHPMTAIYNHLMHF